MLYDASQLWSEGDVSNFSLTSSIISYNISKNSIYSLIAYVDMDDIFYVYILFLLEAPKPQRQPRPDRRANRQGDYLLSVDSIK